MLKHLTHRTIRLWGIISILLCLTACQNEDFGTTGEKTLCINASTKFSGKESRAVLSDAAEKNISNYVVLIYNSTNRNATLLQIKESSILPINVELIIKNTAKYMAIMIANVTASELESQGVTVGSKIDALYSATFGVNTTDNNPQNNGKFSWSGVSVFDYENENLIIPLNPNVAKMTVNINNTSSGAETTRLVKVQVKNVASKVRYAQNALSDAELFTSADNAKGDQGVINYAIEEIEIPEGSNQTYSWYIPHNELEETKSSGTRAERANANATYVEVSGVRSLDFLNTTYKIYPGIAEANTDYANLKNYYVKADIQYNLNIHISDDGLTYSGNNNVSDSGEATTPNNVIKLPAGNNCYMIHPKGSNVNGNTIYEIPIDQVNRYWKNIKNDASRTITSSTKWRPVHIWQDINKQAIYFCDENGNDITIQKTSPNEYTTNLITGLQPIRFRLKDNNTYGNVLIGIILSDNSSGFTWSWHLWITDYNPDAAARSEVNKYFLGENYSNPLERNGWYYYNKLNGLQWGSGVFHYSHLRDSYKSNNTEWESGIYKNCWIMDRNLGALIPNNFDAETPLDGYGMYYQYGRKDPLPFVHSDTEFSKKIYDMNPNDSFNAYGSTGTWSTSSATTCDISSGIKYPNTFYTTWTTEANTNPWYHLPTSETVQKGQKTIFDPCPPGWCLPISNAFKIAEVSKNYITNGIYSGRTASASEYDTDRASLTFCISTSSTYGAQNEVYNVG